ncbi:type II toxin-antitoxin system RelB/DinJ family antitoxin [Shewanella sp. 10N.261.52.F9]|uniref:damage-inducible protein J n=1 Tax=Shewanella sp. 10N.261.52.F9 TaxID=3229684 RepID=UPI0035525DCD
MEARVQFRINEETKKLAQRSAERKGMTLSDAYRGLTEELAREQEAIDAQESWLIKEIDKAYEKLSSGKAEFISNDATNAIMQRKLNKLRAR